MNGPPESKKTKADEERCGQCGSLMFKQFEREGYIFVEVRCKNSDCDKFVIKKFKAYERKSGGTHA